MQATHQSATPSKLSPIECTTPSRMCAATMYSITSTCNSHFSFSVLQASSGVSMQYMATGSFQKARARERAAFLQSSIPTRFILIVGFSALNGEAFFEMIDILYMCGCELVLVFGGVENRQRGCERLSSLFFRSVE